MQYSQENVLYMDVWIFNFWDHWLTLNSIKELTKRSKINCWWSVDIPKLRECYTEMMDRCRPYWENATRKWGINDIPNGECYTEMMDRCHPYSENATRKWWIVAIPPRRMLHGNNGSLPSLTENATQKWWIVAIPSQRIFTERMDRCHP